MFKNWCVVVVVRKNKTVLGFDFGVKYIGVAVGSTDPKMAHPLSQVVVKESFPWQEIATLIREWRPAILVVGIPLNMDGTDQPLTKLARQFLESLAQRFSLPVFPVDERLTTVEARARLFSVGGYRALHKKAVDSVAAQLIVEAWLENMQDE
jgi:putative holliday junction resolvase